MKHFNLFFLFAITCALTINEASASHMAGGQIAYAYLGNNGLDFRVTYTFYRDCAGVGAPATVTINTSSTNAGANFNTTSNPGVNNGNVVPICLTAITTCTGGSVDGREEWVYEQDITLPSKQTDWVFSVNITARNAAITTGPSGSMYVYATLNNTINAPDYNNSSIFANDPAAFVYDNQTFCFNNGTVDVDGDSLVYSLIAPLNNAVTPVTYNPPYTFSQPLTSSPPVNFNTTNGDVCMFPTAAGEVTVMAILVQEYRYGVLIGSVERDIQVSVVAGTDNLPFIDGINSTNIYTDTIPAGCNYSFTTQSFDADAAQCVTMSSNVAVAIPGATFIVSGGCPTVNPRPSGTFDWTPGGGDVQSQPYPFTVTVQDDYCDISGQQVKSFQLWVIDFTADFTSSAPACVGQAVNFYSVQPFKSSYTYIWNFGAGSVATLAMVTSANPAGVTYTTPGAKTVQLTITGPGGCQVTTSNVITINPSPISSFTSTAPQCAGTAVDFTNTGSTGAGTSFAWDFGSGSSPATSTSENPSGVMYSSSGQKVVTLITTNNFGCTTTDTSIITINQSPVASFTSTAPSCTGMNVDFQNTGTTGATYAWDFGSGAAPATSTLQNPTGIVYSTTGIKTVTLVTTLGTCTDTSVQTINISQTPAPSFTSNAPQCIGSAINFTYTGTTGNGWNFFWDFGSGATPATSSAQNPGSVMYSTSGTKTITLTVDNNGMCSSTYTSTITISATPTASFSSTAPACTGANVDFTNTGTVVGVTWSWNFGSGAAPATSTVQSPTGIVYSTPGVKVVTLITTNLTTGCTSTYSTTININQTPTSSFISNAPQCANTGVNFTNTGSSGGQWTYFWDFGVGAMPQNSSAQNPSGILYSTAGTKTITLTISDANCSAISTQTITVNPSPVASFSSNSPVCTGDSVNFINTGTSSGATYVWNFGAGSNPVSSTQQNPQGIIYSLAGQPTVVLVTTLGGCTDTSTQIILINQTPSVSFTSTAPQCVGNAVNFSNTGSTGGNWNFSWSFGAGATPQTSTNENPNGVVYSTAGTKTITLTISDGTCSNTTTQSITINALPLANAGTDTVICNNTSVQIGSASVAGYTYNWFPSSTLNNSAIADPIASPIAPSTVYIVTVTETSTGCTATDSVVVDMLAPLSALAGVDGEICRYDSVQIGAGLITGQNYVWAPSAGLNSTTSPNPVCSPSVTTTYTLSVTGPGCGPVMDEVTVIVHPLPIADAGPNDTITVGSSTQLTATGGIQYTWTPATGLSNVSIYNPVANPTVTTMYYVTVTDVFGCVNSDSMTVYVIEPDFWLPTAFTPNGDMQNDILYAHGEGISNFQLGVYNRWGELIWSTKDIKVGWDGRRQIGGQELPEGAYVYYVKGTLSNNTIIDATGLVNLIR